MVPTMRHHSGGDRPLDIVPLARNHRRMAFLRGAQPGSERVAGGSQSGAASSNPANSNAGRRRSRRASRRPASAPSARRSPARRPAATEPPVRSGPRRYDVIDGSPAIHSEQLERVATRVVPHLVGVEPMPVRSVAGGEQVEDGAAGRTPTGLGGRTPRLGIPAALRMRAHAQGLDDRERCRHSSGSKCAVKCRSAAGSGGAIR